MSDEKRMDTALLAENDENTAAAENALVMKLDKPFTFEGQTYTEVDLSGLEDTTAADLQAVGRFVTKKNPAANPATVEMTLEYAQFMAARVAHLPLEFFERLTQVIVFIGLDRIETSEDHRIHLLVAS